MTVTDDSSPTASIPRVKPQEDSRPSGPSRPSETATPGSGRGVLGRLWPRRRARSRSEAAADRMRRRFSRRQWARRWGAWRWLAAILLVGGLVAGAVWLVFFSTYLTVKQVQVTGAEQLSRADVLRVAGVPRGQQLAVVDLSAPRDRLSQLSMVLKVDVSRAWPDGVLIAITERTAVAAVNLDGSWRGLDAEGVVFRDYPKAPANLPRIEVEGVPDAAALKEAASVVGALPSALAKRVDHVRVETMDQISLSLRDGRLVGWGSAADSTIKAQVLTALVTARPNARVYDVSVPGQPFVR